MAEEDNKKPKIDLRARLGKKTTAGGNASIPPPMQTGAGIPAPPFASKPAAAPVEPKIIQPQAIKIEMSQEVVDAQRKGRSKVIMMAALAAVVGAGIGIAMGGGMERRKRQDIALEGARTLAEEIDKANVEINKIAGILDEAKRKISDGEYPKEAVAKLADVSIPFDGTYLAGKGTGLMSLKVNQMLVDFAGKSSAANEQKERLHLVLSASEPQITDLLSQQDKPKFNWVTAVVPGPHGPMASMMSVPKPFLVSSKEKMKNKEGKEVDYAWPTELEYPSKDPQKPDVYKLYKEGDPVSREPLLIPVDPGSQGQVCPNDTMVRLRGEIIKLEELLKGDKSDPTHEKAGIDELGTSLMDQLKSIGGG